MRRIIVTAAAPDPALIGVVAAVLRAGGIAAIPTDTLYGLAADPFNEAAVARVFTIKNRSLGHALPLIAGSLAQVRQTLGGLPPIGERLAEAFWPGPITLVVPAPAALVDDVTSEAGTVGVRVPSHEVARAVCLAAGFPLTATSANVSGKPPTQDPEVVVRELGARVDVVIDAGLTPGGEPSTIVDVTGPEPRLIRAGAIAWHAVPAASAPR